MTEEDTPIAPDPEPLNRKPKRFMPAFKVVIIASIMIVIAIFLAPMLIRSATSSKRTEAINTFQELGLSLFAFKEQYGSFPSKDTLAIIEAEHPNHNLDLSGDSSNALLRQLYVDTNSSPEALKKGKFHFAYISGLSFAGYPSKPIVLGPIIPGTTKFDPKPFDGYAMALRFDNSAGIYKINKDGHIYDKDGIDILSPNHPFWNGKAPLIHYPE